jgi:hypothetical protein
MAKTFVAVEREREREHIYIGIVWRNWSMH